MLNRAGLLLLVRQPHQNWSLPKGTVEPGETLLQVVRREIAEESGVTNLMLIRGIGSYIENRNKSSFYSSPPPAHSPP